MEAIRKIVDADKLSAIVELPNSMKNKKVEVIILPTTDNAKVKNPVKSIKGILNKYANPDLVSQEKGAWSKAAVQKHGNL